MVRVTNGEASNLESLTFIPDRSSIVQHLNFIVSNARSLSPELQLELAWGGPEEGPSSARLYPVSLIEKAADDAVFFNQAGCNLYVGTTLKRTDAPKSRRSSRVHALLATCVAVDIDGNLVAGARGLPLGIKPQLVVVTGSTPHTRGHLWFGIKASDDLDRWDEATSRAVASCGGDMNARGRSRLMRLGGTVSYPSSSKQLRGYTVEPVTIHPVPGPSYELEQLISALPAVKVTGLAVLPPAAPSNRRGWPPTNVVDVQSALAALPIIYAQDHDLWLRTGFSLYSFDPGPRGLAMFKQFSARSPQQAARTDFNRKWRDFTPNPGCRPITIGWLFAQAKLHGWRNPRARRGCR